MDLFEICHICSWGLLSAEEYRFVQDLSYHLPESPAIMPSSIDTMSDDQKHADVEHAERVAGPEHDEDRTLEEKALLRKIDLFLMPTIFLMYMPPSKA